MQDLAELRTAIVRYPGKLMAKRFLCHPRKPLWGWGGYQGPVGAQAGSSAGWRGAGETAQLSVSYRCPKPERNMANKLSGPLQTSEHGLTKCKFLVNDMSAVSGVRVTSFSAYFGQNKGLRESLSLHSI